MKPSKRERYMWTRVKELEQEVKELTRTIELILTDKNVYSNLKRAKENK